MINIENLVEKAKNGNEEAYTELFGSVYNVLFKIAMSRLHNEADVQDVIQNTFINAFNNIHSIQNNKAFKSWIISILNNEINAMFKNLKKYSTHFQEDTILDNEEDTNNVIDNISSNIAFHAMLENLNEKEKKIFSLRYENNLSIKIIAKKLNMNENTVKSIIRRGKKKLSKSLKPITILFILCAFLVTSVIAGCVINYIKDLFNTHSIGKNNDGVLMAIENLDWFQDIDMDYIDLGDGYKIKAEYLVMDEMNLYMIFDFTSEKYISQFNEMSIPDLKITNENGEVICDRENSFSNQYNIHMGSKKLESDSYHYKMLVYMFTDKFPISKSLNINFSTVALSKKLENIKLSPLYVNFTINLDEKFINRHSTYYTCNNDIEIKKSIITETGFYSLVEFADLNKLNKITITNNSEIYNCQHYTVHSPDITKYQYIIVSNFNDATAEKLTLMIDDKKYLLNKN